MTEIEAVNRMLAAVQAAPVNSLAGPNTSYQSRALSTLRRVASDVQAKGWSFNTEKNLDLLPNGDGEIALPADTHSLELDPTLFGQTDPVQVGLKLYDRKNKTFQFASKQRAYRLIRTRDWDMLPPAAQIFVSARAARLFQDQIYGSSELRQTASYEEMQAEHQMVRAHGRERKPNMLNGSFTGNQMDVTHYGPRFG